MSTLICPVCRGTLQEVSKAGVTIDICSQCRGVWLDRGELEKLAAALGGGQQPHQDHRGDDGFRDWHDDDDDDDRRHRGARGQHQRSKLSRLMDFFD